MNLLDLIRGEISQSDLLNYYNVTIIYEKLPSKINGYVFNYDDINFVTKIKVYLTIKGRKLYYTNLLI